MTLQDKTVIERLPAPALFYNGKVPEPLSEQDRQWLVAQLHAWPKRVNENNTCAIGALTDMATTEFCRLMAERAKISAPVEDEGRLIAERLTQAYRNDPLKIATLCDEQIDRSGNLLGWLRTAAMRSTPEGGE